jgi:hypothetical protein
MGNHRFTPPLTVCREKVDKMFTAAPGGTW